MLVPQIMHLHMHGAHTDHHLKITKKIYLNYSSAKVRQYSINIFDKNHFKTLLE